MKKILYSLLSLLTLLYSCVDYDDATKPIDNTSVRLIKPDVFVDNSNLGGRTVTLKSGNSVFSAVTDANGVAAINNLIPGVYELSTAWSITDSDYYELTGKKSKVLTGVHSVTISGSIADAELFDNKIIDVDLRVAEDQNIVIGKIYYATSKDANNKNYRAGQYIELYNQSDDSVDVAGLYVGLVEAEGNQAYTLENLHEQHNDSVVLLKQIFRIPKDNVCKVAPGGTVLIVNSAIDHTKNNAPMEHDLTGADFEVKDMSKNPLTNNPEVPAMELVYSYYPTISNMSLLANGLCGVVLFQTDEDVTGWDKTYKYPNDATKGTQWVLLPKRYIIDGVECLPNKTETGPDITKKRLYPEIDAACTHITAASGYTGEVVYRKTADKKSEGGHKLLVDTNNSANDFKVSKTIKPREYDNVEE